jgi:hypothetical protein
VVRHAVDGGPGAAARQVASGEAGPSRQELGVTLPNQFGDERAVTPKPTDVWVDKSSSRQSARRIFRC